MKIIRQLGVSLAWCVAVLLSASALAQTVPVGTITYIHNDLLGSPAAATNAAGTVIWREAYSGYGERLKNDGAAVSNKVWYTSRHQDEDTGLVYMGARYYDPGLGRFLSVDPVGFSEGNAHSFNRYAHANNNPYRYRDPDGRQAVLVLGVTAVLGVSGAIYIANCDSCKQSAGRVLGAISDLWRGQTFNESSETNGKAGANNGEDSGDGNGAGKSRNKPPDALPEAEGRPHSIVEKPGSDGQYTTHNGDGTWKQYRGSGGDHAGIPRPNVKEAGKNIAPDGREFVDKGRVRPAQSNEIPGG